MSAQLTCSILTAWVYFSAVSTLLLVGLNDVGATGIEGYTVQVVADDVTRNGAIDRTLHLQITNHISKSSAKMVCDHWALGQGDWKLTFTSIHVQEQSQDLQTKAVIDIVADTARVVDDMIAKSYSTNRVSTVHIDEEGMPQFLLQSIYKSLSSQMKQHAARAQPAYDNNLKKMLQTTFDKNKVIQRISKQLKARGFSLTRATHQELISVRSEFYGVAWKNISNERAAGLKSGSASVIFYDLSLKEKR